MDQGGRTGGGHDQAGPGGAAALALVLLATAGLGAWCRRRAKNQRAMAREREGVTMMDLGGHGDESDDGGLLLPPDVDDDDGYGNTVIL